MGGYFAYVSDEDGSDEIFIRALTDDGRRWRVSEAGGTAPVWSRDGRELLYCNGESILARSVTVEGNAVRLGPVRNVFTSERLNVEDFGNPTFDVAPDGALIVSLIEPRQFCIRVVLNWRP